MRNINLNFTPYIGIQIALLSLTNKEDFNRWQHIYIISGNDQYQRKEWNFNKTCLMHQLINLRDNHIVPSMPYIIAPTGDLLIAVVKDPINEPYNVGDDYNSDTDEDSKLGYKTFLSIEMEMLIFRISNRYFCLVTHNTHERIVIGFCTDKNKQKVLGKTWANCSSQFMLTKLATHIFSFNVGEQYPLIFVISISFSLSLYKPRAIENATCSLCTAILYQLANIIRDTILRVPLYTSHSLGFMQ
ncbi:hypothetical protein ACJX0J_005827 [Zea mays]